jgi:hypothetical protein
VAARYSCPTAIAILDFMIDPVLREEQPHPLRRAAANLGHIHRCVSETDARSPEALTVAGILMSLDGSVRSLSGATRIEDFWKEAHALAKHAQTVERLREEIKDTPQRVLRSLMKEAHDALLEAAEKLTNSVALTVPF